MATKEEIAALEEKFGHDKVIVGGRQKKTDGEGKSDERPTNRRKRGNPPVGNQPMAINREGGGKMPKVTAYRDLTEAVQGKTPFGFALEAARRITTERPRQDQPDLLADLKSALSKLDKDGANSLFWLMVREVVVDDAPVQPMFAVARETGMVGVAYNTAAIARARRQDKLTLTDLKNAGLVEVRFRQINGRETGHLQPMVGHERLATAVNKLREAGKDSAATVLEKHLHEAEKARLLGEAARARAQQQSNPAAPAETAAPEKLEE